MIVDEANQAHYRKTMEAVEAVEVPFGGKNTADDLLERFRFIGWPFKVHRRGDNAEVQIGHATFIVRPGNWIVRKLRNRYTIMKKLAFVLLIGVVLSQAAFAGGTSSWDRLTIRPPMKPAPQATPPPPKK